MSTTPTNEGGAKDSVKAHPLWKQFVKAFRKLSGFTPNHRDIVALHNFEYFKAGFAARNQTTK